MPVIAIIGAGPLGAALAHKLAGRSRVADVHLIDPEEPVAKGKALDILQSGRASSTRMTRGWRWSGNCSRRARPRR